MANKIIHKHSSVITEDGKPKLPNQNQIEYGEIAINYAVGEETISLKNSSNQIVEFKTDQYYKNIIDENEFATANALTDLNYRLNETNELLDTKSPTGHTHVSSEITDSISASGSITSTASGLVQGKAVYNYAAPKSHASSSTTYGAATTSNYGHVKISNGDVATVASANGLAAGMNHTHSNYSTTGHTHVSSAITDSISASGSITSTASGLVQGKAVYNYAAPKSHTHSNYSPTGHTHVSSDITDSISASDSITSDASGLVQGKAVYNYAAPKSHTHSNYSPTGHTHDIVTSSNNGFAPKVSDGGTIDNSSNDLVLTSDNGTVGWRKLPANAFKDTDTKVTTPDNHYTPTGDANSKLSVNASGATAAWSIDVVKGITVERDTKGHITNLLVTSGKIPGNPNTDTKVIQTPTTTNAEYPVLLAQSGQTGTITGTTYFDSGITINPSSNTINAKATSAITADSATTADKVSNNLTITLNNGSTEGSNKFTFDGSSGKTVNITASNIGAATINDINIKIAEITANAPESFDTLKEIADWISNDTTGAAKMANDIDELKNSKSPTGHTHVSSAITDSISASGNITSTASGLVQGKAVYNYAAPKSHASSATTYGAATTSNYGHVKISNGDVATVASADGLAAGMDHTHSNYSTTGHTHSAYSPTGHTHVSSAITDSISVSGSITSDASGLVQGKAVYNYAAPKSHASSATTYGAATTSNYGHVKISNGDVATVASADGLAAGMDHTHSNYSPTGHTHVSSAITDTINSMSGITGTETKLVQAKAVYELINDTEEQIAETLLEHDSRLTTLSNNFDSIVTDIEENELVTATAITELENLVNGISEELDNKSDIGHTHVSSVITDSIISGRDITSTATELVQGKGVYNYAAPINHASSSTTYGAATTSNYGHVKISNGDVATVASVNGLAAGMDHTHSNYSTTGHTHKGLYYTYDAGVIDETIDGTESAPSHIYIESTEITNQDGKLNGMLLDLTFQLSKEHTTSSSNPNYIINSIYINNNTEVILMQYSDNATMFGYTYNFGINRFLISIELKESTYYGYVFNHRSKFSDKLTNTRLIDGVGFNGGSNITHYTTCSTAASTYAKVASLAGFSLVPGASVIIKFTNGNTTSSPTLNINNTGAKKIYTVSNDSGIGSFDAGLYLVVYDGSYYRMVFAAIASNATKIKVQQSSHTQYLAVTLASNTYATNTSNAASNKLVGAGTNEGGGYSDLYTAGVTKKPLLYSPFAGNLYVGNATLQVSDERLKDFENDVVIDFDKLKQIPKKYFTWKSDDEKILNIGTSAQELENIYPELVNEYPEGDEVYKTVNYANLSIIALAAIDKLNERIEYLENKLKEYENK